MKYFACGGAAVPPEIVYSANRQFSETCCFRVFGSSEAPLVTLGYQGESNADLAATTDGEAVDYEIRIVDDNGDPTAPNADGEVPDGEIEVRGPAMMIGYADAGDTADAITPDGFFKTGDIGFINSEGALCISGRKKDLIIRGGENISAKEIEDVLHLSSAVREAAVVSMPHERLGEGVCAFIILTDTAPKDSDEAISILLEQMAESGLAKQKRPEKFIFVDDLPRTASGKIRKDKLREQVKV
jgi:acyl-CoA synthetase (AMP-forming)/AMP-acid ligase II